MLQTLRKQAEYRLFAEIRPIRRWVGPIGLTVAVGVAYFLAARLSLHLLTKPDGVAVFWPAAGVAAGVLIAVGPGARWSVAAATIGATVAANLLGDRNLPSVIAFGVCNAAEALLVAWLIEWHFGPRFELDRLSHVLGLVVASAIATSASGLGGKVAYVLFHSSTASALTIWRHWFASDAIGIITVAPLLIGLCSTLRNPPPKAELLDGIGALTALTAVVGFAIFAPLGRWTIAVPIALVFPLMLWLTANFNDTATTEIYTHEVAQAAAKDARVVYVDNDPMVLAHARALLTSVPEDVTAYLDADLREPDKILTGAARLLDFGQPVAVLLIGILQLIPDADDPHGIVARLIEAVPPGSWLAMYHPASDIDQDRVGEAVRRVNARTAGTTTLRSHDQVARLFNGLQLLEPGLVQVQRWQPGSAAPDDGEQIAAYAGLARKS